MRNRPKTVFLLLDAFRGDYINPVDTPFLYEKTRTGIFAKRMRSTAGFNQRTTICTGATGRDTNTFTMFTFDPEGSPFRFARWDPRRFFFEKGEALIESLPGWPVIRQIRGAARILFHRRRQAYVRAIETRAKKFSNNAPAANIPLTLLPRIGTIEDRKPIHLPGAYEQETVFDVFVREGVKYRYLMYPEVANEDDAVLAALLAARDSDEDVLFAQLCDTDEFIHKCGPNSPERRKIVGEVDRKMRQLVGAFGEDTIFILAGDHGMTEVTEELDIPRLLRPLERVHGVKMGRDYDLFLDSTMARFKAVTEKAGPFLEAVMQDQTLHEKGVFVDDQISNEYSLPTEPRYGDLMWWANLGVLVFPDYFHDRRTHDKGMHGYRSEHDEMKGCFIAFGAGIEPRRLGEVSLMDVCPSICSAVGVSVPSSCRGSSLIPEMADAPSACEISDV